MEGWSGETRLAPGAGVPAATVRRLCFLADVAYEANTLAGQRLDQPLFLAAVADRLAGAVQSRRQRRFRNDASAPDGGHEIVLADDALAIADQIDEDIENLRRKGNQVAAVPQLPAVSVEHVVFEQVKQLAAPLAARDGGPLPRVAKNKDQGKKKVSHS